MMVIAVGAGERIGRVLPELGALLRRPLLTLERVRICKRDGQSLTVPAARAARPATAPSRHRRGTDATAACRCGRS